SNGDWVGAVEDWAGTDGIDVVLDLVSGPFIAGDLRLLAIRGRIVVVGLVGGIHARVDLGVLLRKRGSLIGTVLRSRSAEERVELVRDFEQRALPLLASGRIAPVIDRVHDFADIVEAHQY